LGFGIAECGFGKIKPALSIRNLKSAIRNRKEKLMGTLWQDVRYGVRLLLKSPGFALVAVFVLALGIGANSAIFSVVNAVLLRPLPYADPDRLVILWEKSATQDTSVSYPNFIDWRDQNQVFERIAAFRRESFNLIGAGEPERLSGRMISSSFFSTLGVQPLMGRDFVAAEDRAGGNRVVILSHGFWQRRFGGAQDILGKQLSLNNESYTVAAVMPADYRFGSETDIFVPIGLFEERYKERGAHPGLYVIGRLKPGITQEQGRAEMDTIMARLGQQYPDTNADRRIHIESLYDNTVQDVRPALLILLGAVGFVLLIACANVANLLLARAVARQKEIAIRTAMGASRWRIVRQLLTESVMLSIIGGGLGLLLALWGTDLLTKVVPADSVPRLETARIDMRVLGFTMLAAILTGIIFGLAPALQASKTDLNESLKEGDRGSTGNRHRVRSILVIAEVALALVLLIGAGLMVKSFWRLQTVETGFDSSNLLTMQLSYTAARGEGRKVSDFFQQVEGKIRSLPGVESVAFSNGLPFFGAAEQSFEIEGRPPADNSQPLMAVQYMTTPDYLQTLGIRLKRGRYLTAQDRIDSPQVVVIDESLAQKYFPGEDPIGKRLQFMHDSRRVEIVGVVEHVKHYGLDGEVPVDPQFYFSLAQVPDEFLPQVARRISLTVRTSRDPMNLVGAVRQQIMSVDPNQPIYNVRTMDQRINESIATRRFSMSLLITFALVALVLAAVGIYGVVSYSITQRTHEIGIRMALGAQARDILKMVLGHGMLLILIGISAGLVASFVVTRVMATLLFGVSATDPLTFAGVSLLLAVVAFLAIIIPARRATKVDPMVALRNE
jgi:putative ABC transport system permease protein